MASIWSDLSNGESSASDSIMGPAYSYADHIQGPSTLGVGTDGNMSQLSRNTSAITQYIKYMISGPALGNQYFIATGGQCIAPDGSTQDRSNYINNVSSGDDLVPAAMKQELGGIASDFNGLIPGMLQDVEGLNPITLFSSLSADAIPACKCYTCPTVNGTDSKFLTSTLSPDFDPDLCKEADTSACKPAGKESFSNRTISFVPVIIALLLLVFLQFKR
jgi:hypothetical protein